MTQISNNTVFGRPAPSDLSLEEAVLGAVLLEKDTFRKVCDLIDYSDFYDEAHKAIYKACSSLFNNNQPIDILTVTAQLRKENKLELVGGAYKITELSSKMSGSGHVESHAAILKELSLRRKLIHNSLTTYNEAFDSTIDVFEAIDHSQTKLTTITNFMGGMKDSNLLKDLLEVVDNIEKVVNGQAEIEGLKTGFLGLDKIIGRWEPTNLIILAARPGMGKSALALRYCVNQVDMFGIPSAIFSLEMSKMELIKRLISLKSKIFLGDIRFGKITKQQLMTVINAAERIGNYKLHLIDDCFTLTRIKSRAKRLIEEFGVKFIVIDYLQLITFDSEKRNSTRENEISTISRQLKLMAKELNVPVIALSQLSRSVESRGGDKRPKLSDLRESGAIEQDADMVMFLYRPEYYGIYENTDGSTLPTGYTELIIAKHRNGALDMAPLIFLGYCTDFKDFAIDSFENKIHNL
jgi:replicative DNA helicase